MRAGDEFRDPGGLQRVEGRPVTLPGVNEHLVVYVGWAVVGGIGLGGVVGLGVMGLAGLAGAGWPGAGIWGGAVGCGLLVVVPLVTYFYAMTGWKGPGRIAEIEQGGWGEDAGETPAVQEEEPWRVIRPQLGRGPMSLLPARVEKGVERAGPSARREIEDLCRFISVMWPTGDITQANCERMGFTRRWWDRYIGGSRAKRKRGTESGRGLLDRAGVIEKEGGRWAICSTLEEALSWNNELREYADALARFGGSSQSGKSRQDRDVEGDR